MSVLSDRWIKKMAIEKEMIKPFVSEQKSNKIISYGLSSYGYDARVSDEFKIFTDVDSAIVDPKDFKKNSFVSRTSKECIIPPNSFALASTVEYFKIYLRTVRYNSECDTSRTRLGRPCHARIFQYYTFTSQNLCQ